MYILVVLVTIQSPQKLPPPPKDGTIFLLAIALSCMHLCCPDPRCLCRLQCRNHSSLATVIPPPAATPFYHHCQLLSSHSHCCQPLLAFTTPIVVVASFPAPSSVVCHSHHRHYCRWPPCHPLFDLHHPLFDSPLPPSMVVIPPTTACNPCTPLCPSCSLVWLPQ